MSRDRSSYDYHNDVAYEVWRRGGNPDRVSFDCTDECYYRDREPEACAADELRAQRRARERRIEEQEAMREEEARQEAYWLEDQRRLDEIEREMRASTGHK